MAKIRPRDTEEIDTYIGNRVRQVRISVGKSQTDIADELGISFQQVQKYENGTNRISVGRLYKIAKFLEVSFDYFVDGYEKKSPSAKATSQQQRLEAMLTDKRTMNMAFYYQQLGEKLQKNILDIVKEMAERP